MARGKTTARPHLAVKTGGQFDCQSGSDARPFPGVDCNPFDCVQVHAGILVAAVSVAWELRFGVNFPESNS